MAEDLKSVLDRMDRAAETSRRNLEELQRTNNALIAAQYAELQRAIRQLGTILGQLGQAWGTLGAQLNAAGEKRFATLDRLLNNVSERLSKKLAEALVSGRIPPEMFKALREAVIEGGFALAYTLGGLIADSIKAIWGLNLKTLVGLFAGFGSIKEELHDLIGEIAKAATLELGAAIKGFVDMMIIPIKAVIDTAFSGLRWLLEKTWQGISAILGGIGAAIGAALGSLGAMLEGVGKEANSQSIPGFILNYGVPIAQAFGFLASGGTATRGKPYIVGENGPELFVPDMSGRVVSNENFRSLGGTGQAVSISYNIDARGADAGVEARIRLAMRESEARTINAVRELANRGGSYAKTLGRRA